MAELSNIAAELSKGKNVDMNLSKYADGMNSLYGRMGYVKLALNLYSFAEVYGEDTQYTQLVSDYALRLANAVKAGISDENDDEADSDKALADIDELRDELIERMEILTAFTDRFQVYEYVLNRIEYNFKECDINSDYYNDKFEKDILSYIVSDKDNSVVNMKIGQVVSQIPMRLSKNKFFELLHDAFTLYKGSDTAAVEDFIYMLRSVSMLHTPENFDTAFDVLSDSLNKLDSFSYVGMTQEDYFEAAGVLADATEYVVNVTDVFVLLMDAVNDAYMVLLTSGRAIVDGTVRQHCLKIIDMALDAIYDRVLPTEDSFDSFVAIEGVQEKLSTQLSSDSYALDDVHNSYMGRAEQLGLSEDYEKLFKLERLSSGSSFMKLVEDKLSNIIADEAYINSRCDELTNELADFFAEHERPFNRAVMSGILGSLPVFFNNMEEIKKYIHVALGQCSDEAERKSCMKLMLDLMNE